MSDKGSITLMIIDGGMVEGVYYEGILEILMNTTIPITRWVRAPGNSIPRQRQNALQTWYNTHDTEWCLWIDTDILVTPESLGIVWDIADSILRPVVCGVYHLNFASEGNVTNPVPSIFHAQNHPYKMKPVFNYPENTLMQVDFAGFGFTLIHKSVITKMFNHYENKFLFNEEHNPEPYFLSEDISFFMKLQTLNIPVYVHTKAQGFHMKKRFITKSGWIK